MKTILIFVLSLGLLVASVPGAVAQESGGAYVEGLNTTAIYADAEGNDVMTLTVTDVDNDFQGYMRGQYAEHGYSYRLIAFTIENTSGSSVIMSLSRFVLIDTNGVSHYPEYLRVSEDDEFESEFPLGDGDVHEQELVFMVPAHIDTAMFQWQPEFGHVVLVNLMQGEEQSGAVARGLRSPAFITDDFGNIIATMEVTAVAGIWNQYSEWSAPDEGYGYWALRVKITNESDRPLNVESFRFNAITQDGESLRTAIVGARDDVANDIFGSLELMPGDAVVGMLIYEVAEDEHLVMLHWNRRMDSSAMVILVSESDSGTPESATPVAN